MVDTRRNTPEWVTWLLIALGGLLLLSAAMYAALPSHDLPTFVPGYKAGAERHHRGHALLLAGFAVVTFIGAWQSAGHQRRA